MYWTGAEDNYWNNPNNWSGADSSRPVPTNDDMNITASGIYKDNEVVFNSACCNDYRSYVNGVGTAEKPLVFRAIASADGLQFSKKKHTYIGNESPVYLQFKGGIWSTVDYNLEFGASGSGCLTLADGAVLNVGNYFHLKSGELVVEKSTVKILKQELRIGDVAAVTFKLNKGGVLVGKINNTQDYGGTVIFNGGIFKAKAAETLIAAHNKLDVTVDDGGGVIDNSGYAVTIDESLSGIGGMTFTGGGKTMLKDRVKYSGKTSVTPGTMIATSSATTKNNILNNGLVVAGIPKEGDEIFIVTKDGESISEEQLAKVTCPLAPTTTFALGGGNTNIVVDTVGPTLDNYWTGAANDGDLSNVANWKNGVPAGEAIIYCTTNSTLTKGETFAPSSITFLAGSAPVTVNGDFFDIKKIVNNSASRVEFLGAVAFSGEVDVMQDTGPVKFTGGATGVKLARETDIHGIYTFSQTGDFTEIANTTVKSDGVYNLPNGCFFKHNGDFHVEAGGKVVVENAKIDKDASRKLLGTLDGSFVVTEQFVVSGNNTHYMCIDGNGTFIVKELRVIKNGKIVPAAKTIMGPGGIVRGAGYVRVQNDGSHEFGSYADWTMYYNDKGDNTATAEPVFYKHSSSTTWSHLTFDTTDYDDRSIGRTITCEAPIGAADAASAEKFDVTVKGKGKFVFANTSNSHIFSGGLMVQDTATIEVKANAKPGNGAITLGNGTTLALTATSNAFTPLANTLNLPTEGTAIIRIDGNRLKGGVDHEIATVGTGATANVTLDENSAALAGRKHTLKVEDGKLKLNIQPDGLMVIIR